MDVRFSENRDSFPALLIVTPFDKSGKTWTSEQPSPMILRRLSKVASASLQIVDLSLPEADSYSVLKVRFVLIESSLFPIILVTHKRGELLISSKFFVHRWLVTMS